MSTLGQFLKKTRMDKNITIDQVQEITKIRKRYLEAIEKGEYQVLPGAFYARAFIKSYAEVLDLDAEQLFKEYAQEIPQMATTNSEAIIPKRKRTIRTTSPKVGKWLSRILLYSFIVFVFFALYMAAVNNFLGEEAAEPPTITGPTGDGEINTEQGDLAPINPSKSGQHTKPQNNIDESKDEVEDSEPVWTILESNQKSTSFEYSGAKEMVISLQAKDRVWFSLTDTAENKVIDTALLTQGAEKEWDLSRFEQVVLRLGNPPGAILSVNGVDVDIADLPQPHDLIINFKSAN